MLLLCRCCFSRRPLLLPAAALNNDDIAVLAGDRIRIGGGRGARGARGACSAARDALSILVPPPLSLAKRYALTCVRSCFRPFEVVLQRK